MIHSINPEDITSLSWEEIINKLFKNYESLRLYFEIRLENAISEEWYNLIKKEFISLNNKIFSKEIKEEEHEKIIKEFQKEAEKYASEYYYYNNLYQKKLEEEKNKKTEILNAEEEMDNLIL